jgi:hypothetical protein
MKEKGFYCSFITGQNEREETTQNTTVTKSAASRCASYNLDQSNYVTYITATLQHPFFADKKKVIFSHD